MQLFLNLILCITINHSAVRQIRRFSSKLLLGLLVLTSISAHAQSNIEHIDSILNAVKQANELKVDIKQVTIAYSASKAINYEKGMAEALVLYSKSSYDAGQYDNAFKYITQAENISAKINDPVLVFRIRACKGLCYSRLGFYKEADQILRSAIPLAKAIDNKEDRHNYLVIIYTDLVVNYQHLGNVKAKDFWGKKASIESQQLEKSDKYLWVFAIATSNRGSRFAQDKQYDSAEFYQNKALLLSEKINDKYSHNKYYARWVISIHAGDLYYAEMKFSKAELLYREAADAANQIKYAHGLKSAYADLAKVYKALNRTDEALKYAEKSDKLGDSLAQIDKYAIKAPLDYIIDKKEQQLTNNRNRYHRIIFISSFLLLIITVAVFIYRYKLKREIKLSSEKNNQLIKKIELNEDKRSASKIEELKEVVQLAVNNSPAFLMKFNEFDPEFSSRLLSINPSLIAVEIEFCALLRLNFETKEIARCTNISVRAVEGKKYRIRKKLSIPSDQDINIWMTNV
jgi:tetratricopeptide (TPR) repeat protein